MKQNRTKSSRRSKPKKNVPRMLMMAFMGLICASMLVFVVIRGGSRARPPAAPSAAAPEPPPAADVRTQPAAPPAQPLTSTIANIQSAPAPAKPSSPPPPAAEPRQLVAALSKFSPEAGQAEAAAWKAQLQQLVQLGAAAVPALAEYLDGNQDFNFGKESAQMLGYASARAAIIDALRQIGGPEAIAVMAQTLQVTGDPREIAVLARDLETLAPEQYRGQALDAARQALQMAADGKLENADVGPLFEMLQRYGGAGSIPELEQAMGQWKYYAVLALAQLGEDAGVPSLIRLAQADAEGKPKPGRDAAIELLAQVAGRNADARAALLEQARAQQIPSSVWLQLASVLGGDQVRLQDSVLDSQAPPETARTRTTHIAWGNQNFYYAPPAGFTGEQIDQQLAFLEQLRAASSDANAATALQQARAQLEKRRAALSVPSK